MNSAADNMDQVDALPLEAADEVLSEGAPDLAGGLLPFGFSKANQVVLERSDSGLPTTGSYDAERG